MPAFSLDVYSFVRVATLILVFFGLYALWRGRSGVRIARELPYFRLRKQRILSGWRSVLIGVGLLGAAALAAVFGEQAAYAIFPVTPTPTASPTPPPTLTPSLTPTETLTPSITPTLQFSLTPSPSAIPEMPPSVALHFTSEVTPNPAAVFSPFMFARGINLGTYSPVQPGVVFANPVAAIYAIFSYDQMAPGVQWTALWYRQGELVHYETKPWDGGTGGLGFTEWIPDAEEWLPGAYQVQLFVGMDAKLVGEFEVTGEPATSTPTPSATATYTPTPTRTNTPTPTATHTRQPTATSGQ